MLVILRSAYSLNLKFLVSSAAFYSWLEISENFSGIQKFRLDFLQWSASQVIPFVYTRLESMQLSLWNYILPQKWWETAPHLFWGVYNHSYTLAIHDGKVTAYGCDSFHWGCSTHSGRSSVHLTHKCSAHCYCSWAHSTLHNRCHSNLNHTALGNSNGSRRCHSWSYHILCTVGSRMS